MRRFEAHRALSQPSDGLLMGAVGDLALKTALMALQAPLAEVVEHNLPLLAKLLGASGMYLLESSGENARFRCMRSWPETLGQDLGLSQTFLGREALTDLRRGKPLVYEREATTGAFVEAGLNVLPFSSVTIVGLNSSAKLLGLLVACFPDREAQPAGLSSMLSTYGQSLSALFENQIPKGYHGLLPKALEEAGDMVLIAEAAAEKSGEPRIVYANNSFTSATGYSASELKGETLRLLHGPKTDTAAVEKIYRALSAGQAAGAELLCYRRDGSEFWTELELRPLRTGGGAPSHWVCTLRDVTRRKVEEVRLRRSEARFRSLVEHASGVIWIVDREGRIRYAGDSLRRELGYEPSDLLGKNALSFIHTDDVPAAEQMLSRSLVRAGALERGEFRVPHADGSWRWMAVVTQNMLQKPGVGGLVMNLRDISAQRGARESLELQQADLVRAAYVRQALLEIVNDVLQCGIGDAFYQGLLERAVAAIPGAQTGSILIRDAEEGYVVAAALGFDLAELRAVRFTEEHLSRTADLDSYSPRLVTGLARLNREVLDDASAELLARAGRTDEIAVTLSVPVMVGDSLRALLTVDNFESESAFGVEAIETAALFASQVGLALQRLELQRETELRARFRQALTEVANDALADGIDQRFYQRLVERAVDVIPDADAGSVLVRQPGGRFRFVAAAGFDLGVLESVWFEADELYASGQPPEATSLRFDSVDRHTRGVLDPQRLAAIEDAGRLRDIRVALTVPIRLESELVAVLSLDNLHSSRAFCGDSRQMAEAFGTQIRVVLQRLRHQEQSERRARFHQQLSEVVGETLEEGLDAGFYPRLLERAIATVPGAEAGSILLRGKSGDFAYAASQGYALDALQQVSFEADEVKRWHADHHPVLVDFAERRQGAAETRAAVLHEHGRLGEVKSALAVPLTLQDELVAILNLESFSSEH
ncbi:MAG TPA: PAS domain S-box protein, partial [Trueperaceae bacterium]